MKRNENRKFELRLKTFLKKNKKKKKKCQKVWESECWGFRVWFETKCEIQGFKFSWFSLILFWWN
jgi:hypothetical protein